MRNAATIRRAAGAVMILCLMVGAAGVRANEREQASNSWRYDSKPRKVIVGTCMVGWWSDYPGLERRIEQLGELVDEMAGQAARKYPGRGLDLAVFNEYALNRGLSGTAQQVAVKLRGPVLEAFAERARRHHTYIVLTGYFEEADASGVCSNAAVLIDRAGRIVGAYRKVHPALTAMPGGGEDSLEGGVTPGREHKVFECDFGRVGIQICYDIEFDEGWKLLEDKGAELVVWPSDSPQLVAPAMRAKRHGYWVVSATPRHNASVFEPTGLIAAQIRPPGRVLVHEIDLSWLILPWSPALRDGAALTDRFGDRVGHNYSRAEDRGLFWSNDPQMSIGEMARSAGLLRTITTRQRATQLREKASPGPIR